MVQPPTIDPHLRTLDECGVIRCQERNHGGDVFGFADVVLFDLFLT